MKTSSVVSIALGLAVAASIAMPTISLAQQKSCSGGSCLLTKMCHKVMSCGHKTTVYLSNTKKLYFSEAVAKQMNFKDPDGNALVKSRKIPADFQDGSSSENK